VHAPPQPTTPTRRAQACERRPIEATTKESSGSSTETKEATQQATWPARVNLLIRFLFWLADTFGALGERLSARPERQKMRACPTCRAPSPLIADVEVETDAAARLWECERHGCFDPDGKNVGKRRRCTKCGHSEGPANDGTCHCRREVTVKCCKGVCTYAEAAPGLRWNPQVPLD
jgi:hypothetical protein